MKNDPDPGSPSSHPVTGLRALVVEDNAGDRWFYSELLRSRGYVVRSCESGEEAWKVWLAEAPPLALVDLMLPGIDGFELCRRIRAHPRGGQPVILAITGRDEPEALGEILAAGADDFIRFKVGIGRPDKTGQDPADFVLEPLSGGEREEFKEMISRNAEAAEFLLLKGVQEAMNRFHKDSDDKCA